MWVPRNEHNNAAAQIVGEKGHGIPVSFKTTVTDVSKGRVLFTETHESGHGHGHPNQATTLCKGSAFEGSAEEIFGKELPSEVAPADLIRGVFDVNVIVKK